MANIYYVDPANGDNANDGLSVDKPIKDLWSDNVDYGDKDNISIFYIKRGTELIIPEDTSKSLPFGIVMSWPHSNDGEYWDNRPDDGKDWDDDDSSKANFAAENKSYISVDDEKIVYFKNIDMHYPDRDTNPSFIIKNSIIGFIDCDISAGSWPEGRDYAFVRVNGTSNDTKLNKTIEITRTNISFDSGGTVMSYNGDDDVRSFTKRVNVVDSDINVYRFFCADSDYDAEYGTSVFNIVNSTIKTSNDTFRCYGDKNGSDRAGTIYLKIKETEFISDSVFFKFGDSYYTMYLLDVNIENSSIKTDKYIFYTNADSSDIVNYLRINTINTKYKSTKSWIYHNNSTDDMHFRLNAIRNTFSNQDCVMDLNRLYVSEGITLINNKYENIGTILKERSHGSVAFDKVKMFESNLKVEHIVDGITLNSTYHLNNCVVNGYAFNNISNSNVVLKNCKVGQINSDSLTSIRAINCEISQDDRSPITNGDIYLENCKINNDDYLLFDGALKVNGIIVDSNISGDVASSSSLAVFSKIYNTKISGETVSYRCEKEKVQIMTASPYRDGGSKFSLMLYKKKSGIYPAVIDELFTQYDSEKTTLTLYFATAAEININNYDIQVSISYKDKTDGYTFKDCNIEKDPDSEWDGLSDEVKYYKATIDISDADLDNGDKIAFIFTSVLDSISKYYIDAIIKKS